MRLDTIQPLALAHGLSSSLTLSLKTASVVSKAFKPVILLCVAIWRSSSSGSISINTRSAARDHIIIIHVKTK
jgi:hypothetical protein